jgi:hypothetical protein
MKKMLTVVIIGLLCLSMFSMLPPQIKAETGDIWMKEDGLRLDVLPGSLESVAVAPGSVITMPDGRLRMYYQGSEGVDVRIFSAVSSDGGITWTREGLRLDVLPPLEAEVSSPWVIKLSDNSLRMYYAGFGGNCLFSAISTDGLSWTREGIRLDLGAAGSYDDEKLLAPRVIPLLGGGFRMYYTGFDGTYYRILSAASSDGLTWIRDAGVRVDHGGIGDFDETGALFSFPLVLSGGGVRMYYTGSTPSNELRAILSASSNNGLDFVKESGIRIDLGPAGAPDQTHVYQPSLISLPGMFRMLYSGIDGDPQPPGRQRILSATLGYELGPVGYWKFDEGSGTTATDSSGNGNTGTLLNGPQWVEGVKGSALHFDGIDDSVHVPNTQSLTLAGDAITVEFWMRPETTLDSSTPHVNFLDKGNEYWCQINYEGYGPTPDGKVWFGVGVDESGWHWEGIQTTTNHWDANTWYHIAGTYDGSYLSVYVNGVLENSRPLSGNLFAQGTYPLSIGSYCQGNCLFFNGDMDEVKIYDYARTAEEIQNDYLSASQRALIVNAKWQDVPSAYYPTISTALEQLGIPYDIRNPETLTLDILKTYDFVFIPSLGPYIPPEDLAVYNPDTFADMVEQYVANGGSLMFCASHSILYGYDVREPPIFDIAYVEGPYRIVDFKVTDNTHPIMQGPYRTYSLNERIYAHKIDIESYPNDAQVLGVFVDKTSGSEYGKGIVAFQRGNGKVVASGLQIGWTSSGPAISNGVPAEEWIKLTKNAITWLLTPNQPPSTPILNGPSLCRLYDENDKYLGPWYYATHAVDPDGDDIRLMFSWDDGTSDEQTGFVASGTPIEISHSWVPNTGMHKVKAKAIDIHGAESAWSPALEVTVVGKEIYDLWTGYYVKSTLQANRITSIAGEWIQPTFHVPEGGSYQATWIGIGGLGTKLLQAGIADIKLWKILSDRPAMMPFWMTVDENGKGLYWIDFLHTADPGDAISTGITEDSSTSGLWHIRVEDSTKSWVFTANVKFNPDQTVADWVHEPGAKKSGIASFDPITFVKTELTIGGANYKLGRIDPALKTYLFMMNYKKDGAILTSVSPMSEYEQFSILYMGANSIPANVETTASLHSSADLHVYDSSGNHLGYNTASGFIDVQIPNSLYFVDEQGVQYAFLFEPGYYQVQLVGKEYGEFHLHLLSASNGLVTFDKWFNGTISPQQIQYYSALLSETGQMTAISWEYVFKDAKRGTMLKISTDDKYFQFIAPDKDFGIKYDANMKVFSHVIIICYKDSEMSLVATAIDDVFDFCSAVAWDKQTGKTYLLIDKPNWRGWLSYGKLCQLQYT